MQKSLLSVLIFCLCSSQSWAQTSYTIDGKFLKSVDGKYFAFSYFDEDRGRPGGLLFQLKYESKDSSFIIKNLSALSERYGTKYNGTLLTLKEMDSTFLIFEGKISAKYSDGDTRSINCELKFYLYSSNGKYEAWLYLPANNTVWGYATIGTQATAQAIYNKNVSREPVSDVKKQPVPFEFSNDKSVMTYLDGKKFKSRSTGTEVIISYTNPQGAGIIINGKLQAINLTYTPITKYKAVVEGMILSSENGGNIKVYVNSMLHTLESGGAIYFLQ